MALQRHESGVRVPSTENNTKPIIRAKEYKKWNPETEKAEMYDFVYAIGSMDFADTAYPVDYDGKRARQKNHAVSKAMQYYDRTLRSRAVKVQ